MLQKHRDEHKHTEYKLKHLRANCTEVLNKKTVKTTIIEAKKINSNKSITNKPMFLSLNLCSAPPNTVQATPQNFLPLFDRNGQRAKTGRTLNLNHGLWTSPLWTNWFMVCYTWESSKVYNWSILARSLSSQSSPHAGVEDDV